VILVAAAFLRLYHLTLVPLHHDEGVNGNFLVRLVREGYYHYDPGNYHGPTLYYFAAFLPWLLRGLFGVSAQNTYGLNTVTIRLVPALFGLATVVLVLLLKRRLGAVASLAAAALLAVSPGAVYLSRYFIHESMFVFFTLGIVCAALAFFDDGHPVYLILAAAATALLFATKETAMISAGVLLIALGCTLAYTRLRGNPPARQGSKQKRSRLARSPHQFRDEIERLGGTSHLAVWALASVAVFVTLSVVFYSSFFTNYPKGVLDAISTFQFWRKTGQEAHVHAWWTYLQWLRYQESPVLLLAAVGALLVVIRPRNSLALFAALWGFGLVAAYSLVPYKTPWLTLNFIIPLALVAGYAIQEVYVSWGTQAKLAAVGIAVLTLGISAYQCLVLNFREYDNDDTYYVYVYAHTRRETLNLVNEINRLALKAGTSGDTGITITSPDYWPLPWYLRDYYRVGYYGRMTPTNEPIILGSENQRAELQATYGERYQQVRSGLDQMGGYALRPGVSLLLYARKDLVDR
jgi:uncharacterized protein (TIGR03663 family)